MRGGNTVVFLLPFDKSMASIHVRAKCLADFASPGWFFQYVDGTYPKLANFRFIRGLYGNLYYLLCLLAIKFQHRKLVAIIIKPNSFWLILFIRYALRIKVISDINDPLHLPEFNGYLKTWLILKFSNHIIFESPEYKQFWKGRAIAVSSVIEDTPQQECIFLDYLHRPRQVIWIGSPATSEVLLEFVPYLLLFNQFGFNIKLLGSSRSVVQALSNADVRVVPLYSYDNASLIKELTSSLISFVPMQNSDSFNLRGNLKAKISMACGCLTIASRNEMHERLLESQKRGFLFSSYSELNEILKCISNDVLLCDNIAREGNIYVANNFTRTSHAQKICGIANELCQ